MTNAHPAANPHQSPSRSRPYTYVPPDVGYAAASCADEVALQYATTPAITKPSSRALPAARAAGAKAANTPAPIMEPRPMTTASKVPSRRTSRGGPYLRVWRQVVVDERAQRRGVGHRRDAADRLPGRLAHEFGRCTHEPLGAEQSRCFGRVDAVRAARQHQYRFALGRREDQRVGDRADLDAELLGGRDGGRRGVGEDLDASAGPCCREHGVDGDTAGMKLGHAADGNELTCAGRTRSCWCRPSDRPARP